jgi:acyl-CoA thioester hydrolase
MSAIRTPSETVSELRVRYAETDQMGVVYHANYLVWCEIGRTDYIRRAGRSYAELEQDGVMLAVSDATMRFHASARYDDAIAVHTSLSHVGSRGMTFAYRIVKQEGGALLVSATTSLVSISREGRLTALPREVREWLSQSMREAAP